MTEQVVVFIVSAVPSPYSGGGELTVIGIIEAVSRWADRVILLPLTKVPEKDIGSFAYSNDNAKLEVDYCLESADWEKKSAETRDMFEAVAEKFRQICPRLVLAYHFPASKYLKYFQPFSSTVALLGDPPFLPFYYGERLRKAGSSGFRALIKGIRDRLYIKRQKKRIRDDLVGSDYIFAFASHHAIDFSELISSPVSYIHTPIPSGLGYSNSKTIRLENKEVNEVFEVLHMGHLSGTATLSGLLSLADYSRNTDTSSSLEL